MTQRLAAVVVALIALPLLAQTPRAGEQIQVTLIEVPVNVVDRNGEPVRNLSTDNFQLFDSGQRRAVTHFEAMELSARLKSGSGGTAAAAASRNFMLLFDLNGSSPGTLARARQAARAFLGSSGISGDRIAVGTFSAETGFRLLTSFTADMKLVSAAIETLGSPKLFQPADPLLLSAIEMHAAADMAVASGSKYGEIQGEDLGEKARMLDRAVNDVQRQFLRRTLDGYGELAHLLDRVSGRKQIILLTEGFDAKLIHGRESLTSAAAREDERLIERGEAWRVDTDNRFGNSQIAQDLAQMLEACRRSDVVLNAIDIKGVRTRNTVTEAPSTSNESLFLLTHDTGGMVFKNANSLEDDFQRLLRSQEVVYVLGFEAPSRAAGKFHELKVKLVNVPSGSRALHRAGYFESTPPLSAIERTVTAGEIVSHQIPQSEIGLRTMATPFPRAEGRAQVPVLVEIDGPSMLRAARTNQIQSEVFIYAFDENNVVQDFVHQPLGLDLSKLRQRMQQHGVRLYQTLMLPAGRYSVRTLVRAGDSRYGYSDALVDVPPFDRTAVLGGAAVDERPGDWVPVKPPDRNGVPHEYPFAVDGQMLVPSIAPILRPGIPARLTLYISHASALPLSVIAAVDDRPAEVNVVSRSMAAGTARLLLEVVPPPLQPGLHQLRMQVPGDLERNAALVSFTVR